MINEVWVIDDDQIFKYVLNVLIKQNEQYNIVKEFSNGLEAKEALEDRIKRGQPLPDTILVDINMPVMSGWGFLSYACAATQGLDKVPSFYIMSSSNAVSDKNKSKNHKCLNGYITKPFQEQHLCDVALHKPILV